MRRTTEIALAAVTLLVLCAPDVLAGGPDMRRVSPAPLPDSFFPKAEREFARSRTDTIWLFDADFHDMEGDNAWWSLDVSGDPGETNHWHRDTIRNDWPTLDALGMTWWCGKYDACWKQPRGYGNLWTQYLWRDFTPQMAGVPQGSALELQYNQRYALENRYDYGYVDVSSDGGATWDTTVAFYTNSGFLEQPGRPQDWAGNGLKTLDLSAYWDPNLAVRFRMESSHQNSSQDQYDNTLHSYRDGAWQLDNLAFKVNGATVWSDDCESGDGDWHHEDRPATGQTGVKFWRAHYPDQIWTNRDFTCGVGTGWMWAAVDPLTSRMVDNEWAYLVSPPVFVGGADRLVSRWTTWQDMPYESGDRWDLAVAMGDQPACVQAMDAFFDESPGGWPGGPYWGTSTDNWDEFAGSDYLAIRWEVANDDSATVPHMAGMFLAHQMVGELVGAPTTTYNLDTYTWYRFNDWCNDQLALALADSAMVEIRDPDNITSARLVISDDEGATWHTYGMGRVFPLGNLWSIRSPAALTVPGAVLWYYYSATDGVGTTSAYPKNAPDSYFEYSLLPTRLPASRHDILLVDKHGRRVPGEDRNYLHSSEYYYRETLGILGYEWDVYDVERPSASDALSNGPDTSMYKYYDTQIWWCADFDAFTIRRVDQKRLIDWLNQASPERDRNLLIAGNDVAFDLMENRAETLGFFETWLASDYIETAVGPVNVDSVPGLVDSPGGWDFMTGDSELGADGQAILAGGCPILHQFDVIDAAPGTGAEIVADYVKADCTTRRPAGVAYTHPTLGYQTVMLGFDPIYVMDGEVCGDNNYTAEGYFRTGIAERASLVKNVMLYFGKSPTAAPTGVPDAMTAALSHAYPNPFNPVTKIAYSIREAGPTTIEVYNIAGRVVRTLLDTELAAGASGYVLWDGTNDGGERCASGVYFYRLRAPGYTETRKMVMLK